MFELDSAFSLFIVEKRNRGKVFYLEADAVICGIQKRTYFFNSGIHFEGTSDPTAADD